MAVPPRQLQTGTSEDDAYNIINDNFNTAVQNVVDLGAAQSTVLSVSTTVPASSVNTIVVTLTSKGVTSSSVDQVFTSKSVATITGLAPYVDVYIDTNDQAHVYPLGSSLSGGQFKVQINVYPFSSPFASSLGAYLIQITNLDTISHTYFINTSCAYFPSPATGIFR